MKKYLPPQNENGLMQILAMILIVIVTAAAGYYFLNKDKIVLPFANPLNQTTASAPPSQVQLADHYDLNVAGVSANTAQNNLTGPTISVPLQGGCQINLTAGDYKINQGDCVANSDASFSLPTNSSGDTNATTYAVYIKTLDSKLSQAADCKKDGSQVFCPTQSMLTIRGGDESFTSDVSKLLNTVYLDQGDGNTQRYQLFDDSLKDKIWSANGSDRLAVLRFYPQSQQALDDEANQQ